MNAELEPTPPDQAVTAEAVQRERLRAWWAEVLGGKEDLPHPVFGHDLHFRMEGNVIQVTGEVATRDLLDELKREVEWVQTTGLAEVHNRVSLLKERDEQPGILNQVVVTAFETVEHAEFARGLIEAHAGVEPHWVRVISDIENLEFRDGTVDPHDLDRFQRELKNGGALLLVAVDEVDAFLARTLLDEETRSLWAYALPPTAISR